MTTDTLLPTLNSNYLRPSNGISIFTRFISWCGAQEHDRMLWQGIILSVHGCILTPIVFLLSLFAGVDSYLYVPVTVAMAMNLVPNLAALPTKVTIPVFLLSVLIDLAVLVAVFV